MRIIGFTGNKGSGKSTAAEAIFANAIQVNFADALKDMFNGIAPFKALHGASELRDSINITSTNVTVRQALQTVGVAMRELDPDFWVKMWKNRVEHIKKQYPLNPKVYKYWTVTDVRFENEAKIIRNSGGCIIRIYRPSLNNVDRHISENPIPESYVDRVVVNGGNIEMLHKQVKEIAEQ